MNFSADQVRAVLADADRPVTTADVARECRRRAGGDIRDASSPDVRWILDVMAARGEVVHSSWSDVRHPTVRSAAGAAHGHLVAARDRLHRYWATPALSAKLLNDKRDRDERHRAAVADVEAFQDWWVSQGGPVYCEGSPAPHCHVVPVEGTAPEHETVVFRGTHAQWLWLVERLR